jgi:hypothetical protein
MTATPFLDETRLVGLIQDKSTTAHRWAERAGCLDLPIAGDPYFPEEDEAPPMEALTCCAVCPVALECLATSLVHEAVDEYRFGWWGGFSPVQRELLWASLGISSPEPAKIDLRSPAATACHLRTQRRTVPAIAAELGCTERTVYRYLAAAAA